MSSEFRAVRVWNLGRLGQPISCTSSWVIGRASLARENEAGGSWGQEIHILHVNI